jgi:hypothetical protein
LWKDRNNLKTNINKVIRQENNKKNRVIKGGKEAKKEMTVIKHVSGLLASYGGDWTDRWSTVRQVGR